MRIERISLSNFRGIESAEVSFDPVGVTIIQGPNEVGKTTIADAFMFLLDFKASSKDGRVKALQPVGSDVAPWAEALFTIGPYRLTYRKQWLKGPPATELRIEGPQPQELTGDAAHDRVRELLAAHTDEALFRALRYQQGAALTQAPIEGSSSLLAALDAAAGGLLHADAAAQDSLRTRVEQERLRYFTPGGAATKERRDRVDALTELKAAAADLARRRARLQEAADHQLELDRELGGLDAQKPVLRAQLVDAEAAVAAAEGIAASVARLRDALALAQAHEQAAGAALTERHRLEHAAAEAREEVERLRAGLLVAQPELDRAQSEVAAAERELSLAAAQREAAEAKAADARRLADMLHLRLLQGQLSERLRAVQDADSEIEQAQRSLSTGAVTEASVEELAAAETELAIARRLEEAGLPRVRIEAREALSVGLDGEWQALAPGESAQRTVAAPLLIEIEQLVRLTVEPPVAATPTATAVREAAARLERLLERVGAESAAHARELLRERQATEQTLNAARGRRAAALRDSDAVTLQAERDRVSEQLAGIERVTVAVQALSLDEADAHAAQAATQLELARERELQAGQAVRERQVTFTAHREAGIRDNTLLEAAQAKLERCADELASARAASEDRRLEDHRLQADQEAKAAAEQLRLGEAELEAADPTSRQLTLANARELLHSLDERRQAVRLERERTHAALELGGHEGLADREADALAKVEASTREIQAQARRAAAVQRLHAVLSAKRESAQQLYARPYQHKLNEYARVLYQAPVEVRVEPSTFAIESRTLDGRTVPFDALSGGAREQLSVLARLACAALVSPAHETGTRAGVPVIIDDALGYSDTRRLPRLGALFNAAGRDCQVIVLTCVPDRYRGIGSAHVVRLGSTQADTQDSGPAGRMTLHGRRDQRTRPSSDGAHARLSRVSRA